MRPDRPITLCAQIRGERETHHLMGDPLGRSPSADCSLGDHLTKATLPWASIGFQLFGWDLAAGLL